MNSLAAYIIAARRSAIGRVGGLHKQRRIEELGAPIVAAALQDSGVAAPQIDALIVGNATQGGNPARIISLAAGLPESVSASTIDRQCGSGLDAIVTAIRSVTAGEADAIIAGGAEAISTAPWRVAKPKSLHLLPRFLSYEPLDSDDRELPPLLAGAEALASRMGISRAAQDAYALRTHLLAETARTKQHFVGEIVPIRANAEEARDQSAIEPDFKTLAQIAPYQAPDGTLTPGNTASMHDGAAMAVVVSAKIWERLGKPRGLRLVAHTVKGVAPDDEASAPIAAMQSLRERLNCKPGDIGVVEMSETSAAQALALIHELGLEESILNPDGGAIARGHPFGAAGAVLVARLFSRMVRAKAPGPRLGVATLGVLGGMGMAAAFEAV
jgi:acetyl-CoA C-acetyltransferase